MTEVAMSERGWVSVDCDLRRWIPCPRRLPAGMGQDTWAAEMARAWWDASGVEHPPDVVDLLADALRIIRESAYPGAGCHQVWIYLRDYHVAPLPVHIGIWRMSGARDARLRLLSGADAPKADRPPQVTEVTTEALGTGVRTIRYKERADGVLYGVLGYAFRVERLETDLQIWAATPYLRELLWAGHDIAEFVRGVTVIGVTPPATV